MITRPLELAAALRPMPRNFDTLFYVNVGLLVLFFMLFGSAFVLGPGVGVDFQLPEAAGANANRTPFTHRITIHGGQIFTDDSRRDIPELRQWLRDKARTAQQPSLQIQADATVPLSVIVEITGEAKAAGFVHVQSAATEKTVRPASP